MDRFASSCSHISVTKYIKGTSSLENFEETKEKVKNRNKLKAIGLTDEEICIYEDYQNENVEQNPKYKGIEKRALEDTIHYILNLIKNSKSSDKQHTVCSSSSVNSETGPFDKLPLVVKSNERHSKFYPNEHPINHIKDLETDLFGHHKQDDIPSINKRRKLLRRIDRKINGLSWNNATENLLSNNTTEIETNKNRIDSITDETAILSNQNSLWDIKEPVKSIQRSKVKIGPKPQTLYTVKNNKIVRLEPKLKSNTEHNSEFKEFYASDLIVPTNSAEKVVLEGTTLSLDEIKSLPKFKDYEPGIPSKTLFLKNLAHGVILEDLQSMFLRKNLRPEIRIMTGKMRSQAFITFQKIDDSKIALDQYNGIILRGKPIIMQYGKGKT